MTDDAGINCREFWEDYFLQRVPEFSVLYRAEVHFNHGELLCHNMLACVLLPFLQRQLEDSVAPSTDERPKRSRRRRVRHSPRGGAKVAPNVDAVGRTVSCLEHGLLNGNHDLREAILVSFLESGAKSYAGMLDRLRPLFGPNLESGMVSVGRYLGQRWMSDRSAEYEYLHWEPVHEKGR